MRIILGLRCTFAKDANGNRTLYGRYIARFLPPFRFNRYYLLRDSCYAAGTFNQVTVTSAYIFPALFFSFHFNGDIPFFPRLMQRWCNGSSTCITDIKLTPQSREVLTTLRKIMRDYEGSSSYSDFRGWNALDFCSACIITAAILCLLMRKETSSRFHLGLTY